MRPALSLVMGVVVIGSLANPVAAQYGSTDGEWRAFAGDAGSTKYSSLDQIDADNVGSLDIAWRRPLVDPSYLEMTPELRYSNVSSAAPLVIDGIGYVPNSIGLVEAFDVETGETLWAQPPYGGIEDLRGAGTRGVAYWSEGDEERILVQRGEYLYALRPDTGALFDDFGDGGRVHLTIGLAEGCLLYTSDAADE